MMTVENNPNYEDQYRAAAGRVFSRLRAERGWSLREFGEQSGISHTSLYAVERGEATPGIDSLGRVAAAFDLDFITLLLLIIDELSARPGSLAAIMTDVAGLTPEQQSEIATFVEFVRYRDAGSNP